MPPFPVPPPRRRRLTRLTGGRPLPLPQVTAVAAIAPTGTQVTLTGSANPQGLPGTCWFTWGDTPLMGTLTPAQPLTTLNVPALYQASLSGLSDTTGYWFAFVASTAAGTVTSVPVQFTAVAAQPVVNATRPLPQTTTPAAGIPHFTYPFALSPVTGASVAQQDTLAEVASCVAAIIACPVGAVPELPSFGVPDPTFATAPPSLAALLDAVHNLEPRATEQTVVSALDRTGAGWQAQVNVQLDTANATTSEP